MNMHPRLKNYSIPNFQFTYILEVILEVILIFVSQDFSKPPCFTIIFAHFLQDE